MATAGPGWHQPNNLTGYTQRVYPNRKVGHVIQTWDHEYKAFHDGIYLGTTHTLQQAQQLVDDKAAS